MSVRSSKYDWNLEIAYMNCFNIHAVKLESMFRGYVYYVVPLLAKHCHTLTV